MTDCRVSEDEKRNDTDTENATYTTEQRNAVDSIMRGNDADEIITIINHEEKIHDLVLELTAIDCNIEVNNMPIARVIHLAEAAHNINCAIEKYLLENAEY